MTANYKVCAEGDRKFLLLLGNWTDDIPAIMRELDLVGLRLSTYAGWVGNDVSFLKSLPFIQTLDIWSPFVKDVSPLYDLPTLRTLSLNGVKSKVDFPKIPALHDVHLSQWKKTYFGTIVGCPKIENLAISGYSDVDLRAMGSIKNLKNLAISLSPIRSLTGAGGIAHLTRLSLAGVNRLESLDGLQAVQKLKLLWIEGAKNLKDVSALSKVKTLVTLNLTDCPRIASLGAIEHLPCLEAVWFYGKTKIQDGDLLPLKNLERLKYAKFVDREHYSHKNGDFPKSLPVFM